MTKQGVAKSSRVYLVGGGIASMAAAAALIRDGNIQGHRITIFEESSIIGGSLDGSGSPESGYVVRGGRMLESNYLCTFDLFDSIPTLDGSQTVAAETFAWNETMKISSVSGLFREGTRQDTPRFGLSERHILTIERLAIEPEVLLGRTTISEQFDGAFFATDFWFVWCTTFAFQPSHSAVEFKRYLVRYAHMVSGFNRLEGIVRTVFNQYDSLVRPLHKWLIESGVVFTLNTRVTEMVVGAHDNGFIATRLVHNCAGVIDATDVVLTDRVIVTLGSMTEGSTLGSNDAAPAIGAKTDGGAWPLWEALATASPAFGRPQNFDEHIDLSNWVSFATTLHDPLLLDHIRGLTSNAPGEGGLITFPDSYWLASIVIPHQPHFVVSPTVSVSFGAMA